MAKRCQICNRKSLSSATRSHSNIKTKKKQHLNLQSKTIDGKKIKACTSCIRTINKKLKKD